MTTVQTALLIAAAILILAIASNLLFSRLAERWNPPIGKFLNSDGVLMHYIERGDPSAPCVVLFHGNGSMIQDFMISGIIDRLCSRQPCCLLRPARLWV
ncbi:alpha/beta fold hydrolase [Bradyrhizobium sp. RDM4]|uniref:alpha/beta fold hydrolase n=1 Tax=Bradyrhizobium sp. RDM4 TaxID=3378765 RepID=UPI0038FC9291